MSHSVASTPSTLPRYVAGWTRAARREQGRVHTSWRSTPTWMRSSGGTTGGRAPSSKRAATRRRPRSPTGRPMRARNPWCASPGGSRVAVACASCSSPATCSQWRRHGSWCCSSGARCSRARGSPSRSPWACACCRWHSRTTGASTSHGSTRCAPPSWQRSCASR